MLQVHLLMIFNIFKIISKSILAQIANITSISNEYNAANNRDNTFKIFTQDGILTNITQGYFFCSEHNWMAWSSLFYLLLPIFIAINELNQLYLQSCNCLKYEPKNSNVFQTGIYPYILSGSLTIFSYGLFSDYGCLGPINQTIGSYCHIIALYVICGTLSIISFTRLICQYKLYKYYYLSTAKQSRKIRKLFNKLLFSSKYHWLFCCATLVNAYIVFLTVNMLSKYFQSAQPISSTCFYGFTCFILLLSEFLVRNRWSISKTAEKIQAKRMFSNSSNSSDIFRVIITSNNTNFIIGIICYVTGSIGYVFELFLIDLLEINCDKYGQIGYCMHNVFSSIALTFWYWSVYNEQWLFKTSLPTTAQSQNTIELSQINNIRAFKTRTISVGSRTDSVIREFQAIINPTPIFKPQSIQISGFKHQKSISADGINNLIQSININDGNKMTPVCGDNRNQNFEQITPISTAPVDLFSTNKLSAIFEAPLAVIEDDGTPPVSDNTDFKEKSDSVSMSMQENKDNNTEDVCELKRNSVSSFVPMNDFYNTGDNVETPETPLLYTENVSYQNRYNLGNIL